MQKRISHKTGLNLIMMSFLVTLPALLEEVSEISDPEKSDEALDSLAKFGIERSGEECEYGLVDYEWIDDFTFRLDCVESFHGSKLGGLDVTFVNFTSGKDGYFKINSKDFKKLYPVKDID